MMCLLCATWVQIPGGPMFDWDSKSIDNFLSIEPYSAKIGHSWRPVAQFEVWKKIWKKSKFFWKWLKIRKFSKIFDFFQIFFQTSNWATGRQERPILALWGSFDRKLSIVFESYSNMRHMMICTHMAHKRHITGKNRFLCLLCAHHHVPGGCTYLGVRATSKFGIRRFQRRVPI